MVLSGLVRLSLLLVCLGSASGAGERALVDGGSGGPSAVVQRDKLGTIAELNRVTFYPNIRDTNGPEQWVVFYCVDWYPHCQALREAYLDLASDYERRHNAKSLFRLKVRFGEVKCAVDKPLCNEQEVEAYPTVSFYSKGQQVATWSSNNGKNEKEVERMASFIEREMALPSQASFAAEESGSSGGWPLPSAQQHPLQTALQVAPYAAAVIGMLAMIANHVAELVEGFRTLSSTDSSDKELQKASGHQAEQGLRSRLPESWARRTSIEL